MAHRQNENAWNSVIWAVPKCPHVCMLLSVAWWNYGQMIQSTCCLFWSLCSWTVKTAVACCTWIREIEAETTACLSCLWLSITLHLNWLCYVFPYFYCRCACMHVCLSACVDFCPTWHIWMCLAQPKFPSTNPQALHNPSLLCNDCCSSPAEFTLSSFSCPTPCPVRSASLTTPASEQFLPVKEELNQLSYEIPARHPGTSE